MRVRDSYNCWIWMEYWTRAGGSIDFGAKSAIFHYIKLISCDIVIVIMGLMEVGEHCKKKKRYVVVASSFLCAILESNEAWIGMLL